MVNEQQPRITASSRVCPYFGVMELHGIVCGQRHAQSFVQEFSERVLGVFQEQAVVAEWRHGDWNLSQVIQVLQNWALWEDKVQSITLTGADRKDVIDSAA